MSIRECIVTPDMARALLDKNVNNRHLSSRKVDVLISAMKRGEWQYNGDTIRISKSGRLLDGQHRLSAIEKSGIPQKYIIVDGLDDESFTTIDIGSARTSADMLGILGEKNSCNLAAISKLVLMTDKVGQPFHGTAGKQVSHSQIVDFAESNEQLIESVAFAIKKWPRRYMGPSVAGYCHHIFGRVSPELRDAFMEELISGEFSYQDSPVRYTRDLLIEEKGSDLKRDKSQRIAILFKTFRLFKDGKSAKIVRLEKDSSSWYKL